MTPEQAAFEALAARLQTTPAELLRVCSVKRPCFLTPGKVMVKDEGRAFTIGTALNLRRELRTSDEVPHLDRGWFVAGYTRNRHGDWTGYALVRKSGGLETNLGSSAEAFDVLEGGRP